MYRSRNIDCYEDLDLTLGLSPKRFHAFGTTCHGGYPELITIEDDDDNDGEMPVFPQGPSQVSKMRGGDCSLQNVVWCDGLLVFTIFGADY